MIKKAAVLFVLIAAICIPGAVKAQAAVSIGKKVLRSNAKQELLFIAYTDNKWWTSNYISFKSVKGKAYDYTDFAKTKKRYWDVRGAYSIKVEKLNGDQVTDSKTYIMTVFTGSKTTDKLDANSKYRVTVRPLSDSLDYSFQMLGNRVYGVSKQPKIEVSKVSGIKAGKFIRRKTLPDEYFD